MPHAPTPHENGKLAFLLSLDDTWLAYIAAKEIQPRALYSDEQYDLRLQFLNAPNAVHEAAATQGRKQIANAKQRCMAKYEIKWDRIFHKPIKDMPMRYLPHLKEAFKIMAYVHAQLHHCGVQKTWEKVIKLYWGITEEHVAWMTDNCWTCQLDKSSTTKPIITPIPNSKCNERLQIDLMDLSTSSDNGYKWVLQMKDHFSTYVALYPLRTKKATGGVLCLKNYSLHHGNIMILHTDNRTEFKGEVITRCENAGTVVVPSAGYKPSTQDLSNLPTKHTSNGSVPCRPHTELESGFATSRISL